MTKTLEISLEKRSAICALRDDGYSLAQIGKKLNVPKTSVSCTKEKGRNRPCNK